MKLKNSSVGTNTPNFQAKAYRESRPIYPGVVFDSLVSHVQRIDRFIDLGCGSGQSTTSFLRLGIAKRGTGIDIDPEMILEANRMIQTESTPVDFSVGAAEAIPVPSDSVDLVLIGSAFHWFDSSKTKIEIERVLRVGGHLYVFEYQFPKCLDDMVLAETVRRKFNLEWRAPTQRPRGTLAELLSPFRNDAAWQSLADARPRWEERLDHGAFLSHLFTQSRYRHAEGASADPTTYRTEVSEFFLPFFSGGTHLFDMMPRTSLWKRIAQKRT